MDKQELDIRVLATIRTDLVAKVYVISGMTMSYYGLGFDDLLDAKLEDVSASLDSAIRDLNSTIDRINKLSKE